MLHAIKVVDEKLIGKASFGLFNYKIIKYAVKFIHTTLGKKNGIPK